MITTGDVDTAFYEVGRGSPVVLVHGLGDDHRAWRRVLPDLALNRKVVLYDLRGHGGTGLGEADGTLRQLGHDLAALVTALGIERPLIAGFSLGGTIAMQIALDRPELVGGLVLVATSSRVGREPAGWYADRAAMVERGDPRLRGVLDQDTADVYRESPDELQGGLLIRRQSTQDPRGYGNACRAMSRLNAAPLDPELPAIKAPTLIVAADRDRHCPPRASEIIRAGIPDCRLEILPGAGHPIPVERPRELARLIQEASS